MPFGILQRAQVASKSYMMGRSCGAFWDATDGPISLQIVSRTTFLLSCEKLWNYYFKSYWTGRAFGAFWDAAEGPNSLQVVSCTMFLLKIRKALDLLVWNMTAMIRWRPNRPGRPRDAPRQLQDAPKLTLGGGNCASPPGRSAGCPPPNRILYPKYHVDITFWPCHCWLWRDPLLSSFAEWAVPQ